MEIKITPAPSQKTIRSKDIFDEFIKSGLDRAFVDHTSIGKSLTNTYVTLKSYAKRHHPKIVVRMQDKKVVLEIT